MTVCSALGVTNRSEKVTTLSWHSGHKILYALLMPVQTGTAAVDTYTGGILQEGRHGTEPLLQLIFPHGAPGGEFCTSVVPCEVVVRGPGRDGVLPAVLEMVLMEQRKKI